MPFDALTLAAVTDELMTTVRGGRIQRIIQPSEHAVALAVYEGGIQHWIVLSADARHARAHRSSGRLAKAFPTPSSFVMLLRKYLEGGRLQEVAQIGGERILRLECKGAEGEVVLVAEIMGKHSNVLLLDPADKILGAIKIVHPKQSRVRPILPGQPYVAPPARGRDSDLFPDGPRVDPFQAPETFVDLLREAPDSAPVRDALMGLLPGAGPFLVQQISARANLSSTDMLRDISLETLGGSAQHMYELYATRAWQPCLFNTGKGEDFAAFLPEGVIDIRPLDTISLAIEQVLGLSESRDVLSTRRNAVRTTLDRAEAAARGRLESLREGLKAAASADAVKEQGQLVLAYGYVAEPRANELRIPDLDMVIPLDPMLTPSDNAERLFRRYAKLRDARKRLPGLITQAEAEVQRLGDVRGFIGLADSEPELRALEADIHPDRDDQPPWRSTKPEKKRGPRRYRLDDFLAVVGKSAHENEEVTFRLARRDDLWLHARNRTGAHVIVQGSGDPPDHILTAAAALAAYFSEGRTDTAVDVDVAAARDVRKISGGPPGRVTYRNSRTIRVEPGLGAWEQEGTKRP